MNGLLGRWVLFVPNCLEGKENGRPVEDRQPPLLGVIDYVNASHGWFCVRWNAGKTIQHECFKLCDIGKVVDLVGRKKNVHSKNH